MHKATPIFIVGIQRSGTSWLAHILCTHSNITGIQAGVYGVVESSFFSHVTKRFGDLSNNDDFIEFVEAYACSTYFILSGLSKEMFYRERPTTYHGFFRLMMDEVARRNDTDYWLEKSPGHSLCLRKLSSLYPDAKYIGIKRDIVDNIKSALKMNQDMVNSRIHPFYRLLSILHRMIRYHATYKYMAHFQQKSYNKLMLIDYESLKQSTESTTREICNYLNIEFEDSMLQKEFTPNTSFKSESERKEILAPYEETLIRCLSKILGILPYAVYNMAISIENSLIKNIAPSSIYDLTIKQYHLGQD